MSPLRISDAQTRYNYIDPQLEKAEWNLKDHTQVRFEIPVNGYNQSSIGEIKLPTVISTLASKI